MKRLIVNADDFGWSEAVTSGILQGHREGVITSTTLMANLEGAEEALRRARRDAPALAIGLHLNVTEGRPLAPAAEVAPLVGGDGRFHGSLWKVLRGARSSAAVRAAIRRELDCQIRWAEDRGWTPSHVDSHKHVHMHPALLPVVIELAVERGIRAMRTTAEWPLPGIGRLLPRGWGAGTRVRQWAKGRIARRWGLAAQRAVRRAGLATADWFFGVRATGGVSAEMVEALLERAPAGAGELMVHPGLAGDATGRPTRLGESRPLELAALCERRVRAAAQHQGWTLSTYKELTHDERA
jgi:hopanoid biosynthesis associated protein HpnK